MAAGTPVRLILDVDTGADDAVALMLAAQHPVLDLVAASTVNGPEIGPGGGPRRCMLGSDLPIENLRPGFGSLCLRRDLLRLQHAHLVGLWSWDAVWLGES